MELKRKAQYSIINMLVPIILLSVMDLLVFWLPAESGEKVSLGITVLLSFSVFLLVVDEQIPRTSDAIPILSKLLNSSDCVISIDLCIRPIYKCKYVITHLFYIFGRTKKEANDICLKRLNSFLYLSSELWLRAFKVLKLYISAGL